MMAKLNQSGEALFVRLLTPADASEEDAKWLGDAETNRFLETKAATVPQLRDYIADHQERDDSFLLGIFLRPDDVHIGNIKFEPIEISEGRAELGIMIGSPQHRGIGLGPQAIRAGVEALVSHHPAVQLITLGVSASNFPAIRAYERLGFQSAQAGLSQSSQTSSGHNLRLEITVARLLQ